MQRPTSPERETSTPPLSRRDVLLRAAAGGLGLAFAPSRDSEAAVSTSATEFVPENDYPFFGGAEGSSD